MLRDTLDYFLNSSVIAFALVVLLLSVVLVLARRKQLNHYIEKLIVTSTVLIRIAGVIIVGVFIYKLSFDTDTTFFTNRSTGPYAYAYWMMLLGYILLPQLFWFKRMRKVPWRVLIAIAMLCTSGVFIEEIIIVTTSLHRDFNSESLLLSWALKNLSRIVLFVIAAIIINELKKLTHRSQTNVPYDY